MRACVFRYNVSTLDYIWNYKCLCFVFLLVTEMFWFFKNRYSSNGEGLPTLEANSEGACCLVVLV